LGVYDYTVTKLSIVFVRFRAHTSVILEQRALALKPLTEGFFKILLSTKKKIPTNRNESDELLSAAELKEAPPSIPERNAAASSNSDAALVSEAGWALSSEEDDEDEMEKSEEFRPLLLFL
jgi:hypothetical protein